MRINLVKLKPVHNLNESGITHSTFMLAILVLFSVFMLFKIDGNHVSADSPKIIQGLRATVLMLKIVKTVKLV